MRNKQKLTDKWSLSREHQNALLLGVALTCVFGSVVTGTAAMVYTPDTTHNSLETQIQADFVQQMDFADELDEGTYIVQIDNQDISDTPITLITIKGETGGGTFFGHDTIDDSYVPDSPADTQDGNVSIWKIMGKDAILASNNDGVSTVTIPAKMFGRDQDMKLLLNMNTSSENSYLNVTHLPNQQQVVAPQVQAPSP
ncbi:MAG: hypothetical protein QF692_03270 [Alphaproteobacteria bacterium]|jgi:hypothetical protein|nr:hypothetical protein [Alphaproteobacteria bacterium]MDP7222264.1 hypothetical protein [Alphaproteobacteria bacterium]